MVDLGVGTKVLDGVSFRETFEGGLNQLDGWLLLVQIGPAWYCPLLPVSCLSLINVHSLEPLSSWSLCLSEIFGRCCIYMMYED